MKELNFEAQLLFQRQYFSEEAVGSFPEDVLISGGKCSLLLHLGVPARAEAVRKSRAAGGVSIQLPHLLWGGRVPGLRAAGPPETSGSVRRRLRRGWVLPDGRADGWWELVFVFPAHVTLHVSRAKVFQIIQTFECRKANWRNILLNLC